MNFYLVERIADVDYGGVHTAFVLRASSPSDARKLAAEEADEREKADWLDSTKTTCTLLTEAGHRKVILYTYRGV